MQPSTGRWDRYMYTLGRWLLPGRNPGEVATLQPVAIGASDFWTNDFVTTAGWLRAGNSGRRMMLAPLAVKKRVAKANAQQSSVRKRG